MCRYVTMCRYVSVCVGMYIVLLQKYLKIHTDTYIYIQYLHIMKIPQAVHTFNTYKYVQYLFIVTYLLIPAIPSYTCNTYK